MSLPSRRRLHRAFLRSAVASLFVLMGAWSLASAQFSGPALTAKDGVNYPTTVTTDTAILYPPERDILLQPGDSVRIIIYGVPDYITPDRIANDGTISLPLAGLVKVQGMARHEAEALIARRLQDAQMFNNPQVTIDVIESLSQTATVIGEVHGVISVLGHRRLYDVIAAAGGFSTVTSHVVTIHRIGVLDPIVIDLGTDAAHSDMANVPIFAGDTIETARVGSVFMLGAFRSQTVIPLGGNTPLTLMQAMSLVGGIPWEGKSDQMKIIRTTGTRRTVVDINLQKVVAGKAPDPVLQTDDIVLLPTSTWKAVLRNGSLGTAIGIAVAARSLYY